MKKHKILWISLFAIIVITAIVGLIFAKPTENKISKNENSTFNKAVSTAKEEKNMPKVQKNTKKQN